MRPNQKMSYIDAALSVFHQPEKPKRHSQKPSKPHETISVNSSEENLTRVPSVNTITIENRGDPWAPGFLRRLPYTGFLALLMVLLCAGADAVVLYKSDGQEVDTWKISPSVLLSVFSATANVCLEYAHAEGVIIAVSAFRCFFREA
jgi:hypothetical protein